jgi:hypothetical protein
MASTQANRIGRFPSVEVRTVQEVDAWAHRLDCSRAEIVAGLAEVGGDYEALATIIARRRKAPSRTRTVLGFAERRSSATAATPMRKAR